MRYTWRAAAMWAGLAAVGLAMAPSISGASDVELQAPQQKIDYALGVQMGRGLQNQGLEPDIDTLVRGLRDALEGRLLLLSDIELRQTLMGLRADMRRDSRRNLRIAAEENRAAGEAFLAENGRKDGVVTLPSGLQYRILEAGRGPTPAETDTVLVNYRGRLLDGTEFDSSYRNNEPARVGLKACIAGWRLALLRMPVGSRWELYVPSRLAYGARGTGVGVGPEATLIFDVELLDIVERDPG